MSALCQVRHAAVITLLSSEIEPPSESGVERITSAFRMAAGASDAACLERIANMFQGAEEAMQVHIKNR